MDDKGNRLITVGYSLYDITDGGRHLIEKTSDVNPFAFISGFGMTIDAFEEALVDLKAGDEFDLKLTPDKAYGDYHDDRVIDLDREVFTIDGKFDDEHVHEWAAVPLQNADGNRFIGRILSVGEASVRVDLNHPLAGKTINFSGHIVDNREATNFEIERMATMLSSDDDCEGGCEKCSGGCGGKGGHHKSR